MLLQAFIERTPVFLNPDRFDFRPDHLQRLVQAGAVPVTWEAVMAELGRQASYDVQGFVQIMQEHLPASVPAA